MYAGNLGGKCALVTGDVSQIDVSFQREVTEISSFSSPYRAYAGGPVSYSVNAQLKGMSVEYQDTAPAHADIKVLLALARRHPDEYAELREGEEIMKALGG